MSASRSLLISTTLVLLAAQAFAQGLQIDFQGALPSPAFGAAGGQPGTWQTLPCTTCMGQSFPLVDIAGQPTPASIELISAMGQPFTCPTLGHTPDEAALLDDGRSFGSFGFVDLHLNGLTPGFYDVFLYVSSRCDFGPTIVPVEVSLLTPPGTAGTAIQEQLLDLSPSTGVFEYGANFTRKRVVLASGQSIRVQTCCGEMLLNGLQLVPVQGAVIPVCFGTNVAAGCCGVMGDFGRGCPSSFDPRGALLSGTGATNVSADTLVLTASEVSGSFVTFFQGTTLLPPAPGNTLGDGLRCAGGSLVRIATKQAVSGAALYPAGGETPISMRGMLPPIGGTRAYQAVYRNNAPFCTPATFNTTNAVFVTWSP